MSEPKYCVDCKYYHPKDWRFTDSCTKNPIIDLVTRQPVYKDPHLQRNSHHSECCGLDGKFFEPK